MRRLRRSVGSATVDQTKRLDTDAGDDDVPSAMRRLSRYVAAAVRGHCSIGQEGQPQSAVVGLAFTDEGRRRLRHRWIVPQGAQSQARSRASWWCGKGTHGADGWRVDGPAGAARDAILKGLPGDLPDGVERLKWEGITPFDSALGGYATLTSTLARSRWSSKHSGFQGTEQRTVWLNVLLPVSVLTILWLTGPAVREEGDPETAPESTARARSLSGRGPGTGPAPGPAPPRRRSRPS